MECEYDGCSKKAEKILTSTPTSGSAIVNLCSIHAIELKKKCEASKEYLTDDYSKIIMKDLP